MIFKKISISPDRLEMNFNILSREKVLRFILKLKRAFFNSATWIL